MSECHDLRWTSQSTLATFDAIGMQVADSLTTTVVRCELHGAYTSTALTLHLACTRNVDVRERLRQWRIFWGHPTGDGSHRTKRAPSAWRINERKYYAHDGGHDNNGPEHTTNISPKRPSAFTPTSLTQLYAKHGKDEYHHEQSETKRTHKLRYFAMRRIP